MRVATGRVVDGKVVVEGQPLAEGSVVTVVARDNDPPLRLEITDNAQGTSWRLRGGGLSTGLPFRGQFRRISITSCGWCACNPSWAHAQAVPGWSGFVALLTRVSGQRWRSRVMPS